MADQSSPRMTPEAERDLREICQAVVDRSIDRISVGFYCDWCSPDRVTTEHNEHCLIVKCLRYLPKRDDPGKNRTLADVLADISRPSSTIKNASAGPLAYSYRDAASSYPAPFEGRINDIGLLSHPLRDPQGRPVAIRLLSGPACFQLELQDSEGNIHQRPVWFKRDAHPSALVLIVSKGPDALKGQRYRIHGVTRQGRILVDDVLDPAATEYITKEHDE